MSGVAKDTSDIQEIAQELVQEFAKNAVERDQKGGTAKRERDLIRQSGLLKILIPKEYGGLGGSWLDVLEVVKLFAEVDSSIAHVFGYHFVNLTTPHLCGDDTQKETYYKETAAKNLFWGNAFNPVNIQLRIQKNGEYYILQGEKTFCSGSADSDYLLVSARREGVEEPLLVVIPTNRTGIDVKEDWDNFGQRQTDSGTVVFNDVHVEENEVLKGGFNQSEFSKLRINIANFILTHLYLGITEGAVKAAKEYTKTTTRPRSLNESSAIDNPIIQHHYGEFIAQIKAAQLTVKNSSELFQQLWDKGEQITAEEREELNHATTIAKIITTKTGLDISSRIFEVLSSRATATDYGFDRYWRNLRTMTLHVPVDIAIQELGKQYLLT